MAAPASSAFLPKVQSTAANGKVWTLPAEQGMIKAPSHSVFKTWPSQNSPASAWGSGAVSFVLRPRDVEITDEFLLKVVLPPLTVTGGTYSRFVNDANFLIDRIVLTADGSDQPIVVVQNYGLAQYTSQLAFESVDDKPSLFAGLANNTDTLRATASASAQTLWIPLALGPLTQNAHGFFLPATRGFKLDIFLPALANVVETDGTAPVCAITSIDLVARGRAIDSDPERARLMALHAKFPQQFRSLVPISMSGIQLPSGATTATFSLTSVIGDVAFLTLIARPNASVNTPLANAPDNFQPIQNFAVKRSTGEIVTANQVDGSWLTDVLQRQYRGNLSDNKSAGAIKPCYLIPMGDSCQDAFAVGAYGGSFRFTGSETCVLNFPSALPSLYVCDVIAWVWATHELAPTGVMRLI